MFFTIIRAINKRLGFDREEHINREFKTIAAAYPFCAAAVLFLGFQVLVASAGALDLLWPNLPAPIPFEHGRAVHLNLSIFWPLLGSMGAALYFFPLESGKELKLPILARILFWFFLSVGIGIVLTLALGYTEGREYLEAIRPLDWGIAIATFLFTAILLISYFGEGVPKKNPVLLGMLLGAASLLALFIPNMFFYTHPSIDELVRFWVVHLWEEMSLELLDISITAAFLLVITVRKRTGIEKILYFDLGFTFLAGFFATGHHYYWIGTPQYWLWLGGIFSTIQLIPILLLLFSTFKSLRAENILLLDKPSKLGMGFLLSSVFYHFLGAGMLGWIIAVPYINRYFHGTYLTSAHAHLALFGVFGFLALGFSVYILTANFPLKENEYRRIWLSLILLNAGLLLMAAGLILAGVLQTYLWRVAGIDFAEVHSVLTPYLTIRLVGGIIFALGGLLLAWTIFKLAWKNRRAILG